MTDLPLFSAIFSFVNLGYGILVPLVILQFVALLLVPTLLNHTSDPKASANAIFCYLMQAIGVLLITTGALPTLMSVLTDLQFSGTTYFTLLVIFAAGGVMFLWYDNRVREINPAAARVPAIIFVMMFRIIGHLLVLLYGLSFFVSLMAGIPTDPNWWVAPVVMIAYGLLLIWCAKNDEPDPQASVFNSITMTPKAAKTAKTVNATKRKVAKKKT